MTEVRGSEAILTQHIGLQPEASAIQLRNFYCHHLFSHKYPVHSPVVPVFEPYELN